MHINSNNGMIQALMEARQQGVAPETFVTNMVRQVAQQGDPVMMNISKLIEEGNTKEIENIVKNVAKEKGIDFDNGFNSFKQMFRL